MQDDNQVAHPVAVIAKNDGMMFIGKADATQAAAGSAPSSDVASTSGPIVAPRPPHGPVVLPTPLSDAGPVVLPTPLSDASHYDFTAFQNPATYDFSGLPKASDYDFKAIPVSSDPSPAHAGSWSNGGSATGLDWHGNMPMPVSGS